MMGHIGMMGAYRDDGGDNDLESNVVMRIYGDM